MRIGTLARTTGTTPDAIRFYERHGCLPAPGRGPNGYREYSDADAERVRLLVGLRRLDLQLDHAAELAGLCADGHCDRVSLELREALASKRIELRRRVDELEHLDRWLAHLEGDLSAGASPGPLITLGKEDEHVHTM